MVRAGSSAAGELGQGRDVVWAQLTQNCDPLPILLSHPPPRNTQSTLFLLSTCSPPTLTQVAHTWTTTRAGLVYRNEFVFQVMDENEQSLDIQISDPIIIKGDYVAGCRFMLQVDPVAHCKGCGPQYWNKAQEHSICRSCNTILGTAGQRQSP